MESSEHTSHPTPPTRRPYVSAVLVVLFIVSNLVVGFVGGAAGFVILSNSDSPAVQHLRQYFHINAENGPVIPVHQTITLQENSAIIDASKKIAPSVVSILASQQVTDYFGQVSTQETGGGSGFIVTQDGLILTNKHVVSDSTAEYKVILNDGRIFPAKIQATDPLNDLAVVKIDATGLQPVEFGSSDSLQIGQAVIAVGNALGEFNNSVTFGVISAKNRSISASDAGSTGSSEQLTGLLQTDAAINPGNSGGPLVNMAGQVVGIDTAIASTGGGSIGVGFAIPIDSIQNVIKSVSQTGQIIRPYLGVRYIPVTTELKQLDNLSVDYGALVSKGQAASDVAVIAGSPADKAGIKEGDIILEVNGERIDSDNTLPQRLAKYNVGDTVSLKILRDGKQSEVKATLDKSPK